MNKQLYAYATWKMQVAEDEAAMKLLDPLDPANIICNFINDHRLGYSAHIQNILSGTHQVIVVNLPNITIRYKLKGLKLIGCKTLDMHDPTFFDQLLKMMICCDIFQLNCETRTKLEREETSGW